MSTLALFHKAHGAGDRYEPATKDAIATYSARLPSELIQDWQKYGWASYSDGIFWTVDPGEYADTAGLWLPEWHADSAGVVIFGRTGFGDLLVSRKGSVGQLNVHYGRYVDLAVDVTGFFEWSLGMASSKKYIAHGLDGALTRRATKKLGRLEADEMFSFEPALALGGAHDLKHVVKVKLFPQLAILAQLFDEITIE